MHENSTDYGTGRPIHEVWAQQTLTGVKSPNKRVRCEWKRGSELFTEGGEARKGGKDWKRSELGNGRRALVKGKDKKKMHHIFTQKKIK